MKMAVFWVRLIALMMEAVQTFETMVHSNQSISATTQKAAIFILTAVRTSNHT
jgi:hypothetical protein